MHIVRLISQDFMNNNKDSQYVGEVESLVFRALNPRVFLSLLREKKLYAVIQLPSQTLLLSVSDRSSRLITTLFSGVVFKPQKPTQVTRQHQEQQSQRQRRRKKQQQQLQPLQQQHHPQLQQHQFQQLQQQQEMMQQQLHVLQQQMMQYQLQYQSSMQQQISQPQQIVGGGMGHGYNAENGFVVKSEPL